MKLYAALLFSVGICLPAIAGSKTGERVPKSSLEIPSAAINAFYEAFQINHPVLGKAPRIGEGYWSKGSLKRHSKLEYHAVLVNYLDGNNTNRDGVVVLRRDINRNGQDKYKLIGKSRLWLGHSGITDGKSRVESTDIARNHMWLKSHAFNQSCYPDMLDDRCRFSEYSFQFKMIHDRIYLIGHMVKVHRFIGKESDGNYLTSPLIGCSINFVTHTQINWVRRNGKYEEKKFDIDVTDLLPLEEFSANSAAVVADGISDKYFCSDLRDIGY